MSNGKFDAKNHGQMMETTLDLLDAVSQEKAVSQRSLAERLGIALGLTNAILKRCAKKGLLKFSQAPVRRYAYYLTPKGFAEKSRLTAEYLSYSLQFYRTARQEYSELFQYCANRSWTRVVLVGATEMTEIASLAALNQEIDIIGILAPERNEATFCNLKIYRSLDEISAGNRPNTVILTGVNDPLGAYRRLLEVMPQERVLAPKLMRLSLPKNSEDGALQE